MDIPARRPTYAYLFGPLGLDLWRVETNGRSRYAYRFYDQEWGRDPVFEADDFKMPNWATWEETALDIMSYLLLQEGDVEGWFFKDYTAEQLKWRDERGSVFQPAVYEEAKRVSDAKPKHKAGSRRGRK
jgi:hypothetical protein